jgi:hypothetical protein
VIAAWTDLAAEHFAAFLLGLGIGFVLSNRYRIARRAPDMERADPTQQQPPQSPGKSGP